MEDGHYLPVICILLVQIVSTNGFSGHSDSFFLDVVLQSSLAGINQMQVGPGYN